MSKGKFRTKTGDRSAVQLRKRGKERKTAGCWAEKATVGGRAGFFSENTAGTHHNTQRSKGGSCLDSWVLLNPLQ